MINLLKMLNNQYEFFEEETTPDGGTMVESSGIEDPGGSTDPTGQSGNGEPASGESSFSPGFLAKVKGKSVEELTRMLHEGEQTIGRLSTKVGTLTKTTRTPERVKTEISDLSKKIERVQAGLDELDVVMDADKVSVQRSELSKLKKLQAKLKDEATNLTIESMVTAKLNAEHNTAFAAESRQNVSTEMGLNLTDDVWADVIKAANKTADGKLTTEDIQGGLMRVIGVKAYTKALTTQAEQKLRDDIQAARNGAAVFLGGEIGEVDSTIPIDQLSPSQRAKRIRGMSKAEFEAHVKKNHPFLID